MTRIILFAVVGYLSGSILYADLFCRLFGKKDAFDQSEDQNPGTSNAFKYGGFWCGLCTLSADLLKGFLPIWFYTLTLDHPLEWGLALVMPAPVIGHAFPLFYKFKGGKGIAATFGCLLGLLPYGLPLFSLAFVFLFLSLVLRITPHFYRTAVTYPCALALMFFFGAAAAVLIGFFTITVVVCVRLYLSKEEKEKIGIGLLWMH